MASLREVAVVGPALDVGDGVGVVASLGEGDAVDGRVELTVPGSAQAVALAVARPDRQRSCAVVSGERVLRLESTDPGDLRDELGC